MLRFRQSLPWELPKRAWPLDVVVIFPPVFEVWETICRFLSLEYEEGDWWYDEPTQSL
jgi:hypothetical protein